MPCDHDKTSHGPLEYDDSSKSELRYFFSFFVVVTHTWPCRTGPGPYTGRADSQDMEKSFFLLAIPIHVRPISHHAPTPARIASFGHQRARPHAGRRRFTAHRKSRRGRHTHLCRRVQSAIDGSRRCRHAARVQRDVQPRYRV